MSRRAVFLDRDGVLNRAVIRAGRPYPPANLSKMELTPHARSACAALHARGYLLILVTNQPDIARGVQTVASVNEMNSWIQGELALDDVRVCPHDDGDRCSCRKPAPGMLTEAAKPWNIDLAKASWSGTVGETWRREGARGVAPFSSIAGTVRSNLRVTTMLRLTCPVQRLGF